MLRRSTQSRCCNAVQQAMPYRIHHAWVSDRGRPFEGSGTIWMAEAPSTKDGRRREIRSRSIPCCRWSQQRQSLYWSPHKLANERLEDKQAATKLAEKLISATKWSRIDVGLSWHTKLSAYTYNQPPQIGGLQPVLIKPTCSSFFIQKRLSAWSHTSDDISKPQAKYRP